VGTNFDLNAQTAAAGTSRSEHLIEHPVSGGKGTKVPTE